MKPQALLIGICALLLAGCTTNKQPNALYDQGVSWELAQYRKTTIHNLQYNLQFSIPEDKTQPIYGADTVQFTLEKPEEILLDFREEADKVLSVSVNGQTATYTFQNEHIILPQDAFQAGTNQVAIQFIAGDQSLNRNDDFMYTLFVPDRARTAFPCMEQPNMKALFTLSLEVPAAWETVSNTYSYSSETKGDRKMVRFAQTEPLSTYLFAFAAGKFQHQEYIGEDGTKIGAYYRETDPKRIAQLPEIFRQVMYSLKWQEDYTGQPYPFAKYDLVILPGFQFGGMEHTGATFYNDNTLFLSEHPTVDEELSRAQLIAHETSHMWFGDCVTMDWFNDVWTKEVFANYFAAAITTPLFPNINHDLNWMKTYTALAMNEDRSFGGTSIRQDLDNMRNAGLIYNNIIYDKAPVMMKKLVELMGPDAFQQGIRKYIQQFKYGNATWEDLITILDAETTQDLAAFSQVWVNQKGMPKLDITSKDGLLSVTQSDPYKRGLRWPQSFEITLHQAEKDTILTVQMNAQEDTWCASIPAGFEQAQWLPNTDGRAYGLLTLPPTQLQGVLATWQDTPHATSKFALLALLHENYLAGKLDNTAWLQALQKALPQEQDALTASTLVSYLNQPLWLVGSSEKDQAEKSLWQLSNNHPLYSARLQILRMLFSTATCQEVVDHLYSLWENQSNPLLSPNDYASLSYQLAIRMPKQSESILSTQRERMDNPDRLRQFDFISRAAVADTLALDTLFNSFIQDPQARRIEPWTATALGLLNHPLRERYSVKYITPALDALENIQRTGDIFFPGRWCNALLGQHDSPEAYQAVKTFFSSHPDYLQLRKNKILLGSYYLYNQNGENLFAQ